MVCNPSLYESMANFASLAFSHTLFIIRFLDYLTCPLYTCCDFAATGNINIIECVHFYEPIICSVAVIEN